jgi:hypothetical protein
MNLREARKKKMLEAFAKEHDQHKTQDDASERFTRLARRMALGQADEKPKSKPRTSGGATSLD